MSRHQLLSEEAQIVAAALNAPVAAVLYSVEAHEPEKPAPQIEQEARRPLFEDCSLDRYRVGVERGWWPIRRR